jgi:Fe-coproporphyrin III synthase
VIRLPLVTLYLTERCNSRCVSCDYWRYGHTSLTLAAVRGLLPSLKRLGTESVLLSGGEPLLNPEWAAIAALLRDSGIYTWLLTSGLSLAKHAAQVSALFPAITVSLDGADRSTYARIRGLDAFEKVCQGIRAAVAHEAAVSIRVTVQRANFAQMHQLVELAQHLGVRQISFLAVDVANPHAFGRSGSSADLALTAEDLPLFEQELALLEREHAAHFRSGFIAESPAKLRRLSQYFAALRGRSPFPAVRCNAPEFSAVITAAGTVQPCYFIGGAANTIVTTGDKGESLGEVLNSEAMVELRTAIRAGARSECKTCVCSLWRDPSRLPGSLRLSA